ncbi:gamma-carboxygeranoyl-CoA hydratase [Pseudomonas syringae group genomosp. 3]|uniref:gamma-carboxygeranoyl-CoA hydratase n=1 Tax=Pseudomonas syringae group genomosp. 3 TaxID=251701 RepID=UPI0006E61789|nr:gamma-carboxygeranoyl-CoA hydratase [Pseudomonas syringae group genomosp. 3]KPW60954.1 Enoyl-CoA hydratase/isomerase family protein [Pseudomonas syringae pv. berberidis]KPY13023.1 Enoyl-CoA hydratase/isomerase family protein [Pseudomonas syringae pv. philadelphi]RMM33484.1 Enoyl-CoA hydratase/isomerase protein [Pseudomonas syringae pv. berberidis]RMP70803.1 Enoyl-CoA hydratase/isomerase protein [Pseudomonas syringae pv. berberidis]RMQ31443.1 Enoyl-CoA hydratase/isomerase protein [Pseudomona
MTSTSFATIELLHDPRGFATLWLNRADKNNAFNAQMIRELVLALDQVQGNAGLRFLLIRGRGRHFSAGADLAWMQQAADLDYNTNLDDARELAELMYNLARLKIPTLAVVQGAAFGGALGLISCCDMAIAAEDAQFCLSEVRIGLAPAVISPFVVQAIGERATRRYALTAERFDGRQARHIGLIAECYPLADLEHQTLGWIDNLLLNSPQAMRISKELLREVGSGELTPALRRYCESAIARIRTSAEGQEGLRAFLQKRAPRWQQRDDEPAALEDRQKASQR